jgi:hypothetical protein
MGYAMRSLRTRSFILLPPATVFIAKGGIIKLRNWKFCRVGKSRGSINEKGTIKMPFILNILS